jgi:hypothetical protein
MRPPFPPWSDTALRVALIAGPSALIAAVVAPMIYVRTPFLQRREYAVEQPVQFDHRHHRVDDEIDCLYCHGDARRSPYAGVPATEVCMGCHAQVWSDSVQLEPVRRSYYSGRPLRWRRVHRLPDYVFFDHSVHLRHGVGCATCHGRVDRMAVAYQVEPLSMGWCLDCHRDPGPRLRPTQQLTSMNWAPPPGEAGRALASALVARYRVSSETHCTTCHR